MPAGQGGAAEARRFHGPEVARSSRAPDPSIFLDLHGTPPNWSQGGWHGHWSRLHRAKKAWLEVTALLARNARHEQGWEVAPAEKRVVEIRCYRVRLMDHDGAAASIKPILDGLKNLLRQKNKVTGKFDLVPGGGLIYDDSPEYVLLESPGNLQVKVAHRADERTVVTVRRGC